MIDNDTNRSLNVAMPDYIANLQYPYIGEYEQQIPVPPPTITSYEVYYNGFGSSTIYPHYNHSEELAENIHNFSVDINNKTVDAQNEARSKLANNLRKNYMRLVVIPPKFKLSGVAAFYSNFASLGQKFTVMVVIDGKEYAFPFLITNKKLKN